MQRPLLLIATSVSFAGLITTATLKAQAPSSQLQQADKVYRDGVAALSRRDLVTAEQDFTRVVQLAPQAEPGHSALGAVLVGRGQTAAGIRELQKALAIKPDDHSAQLNLAVAYEQVGEHARALTFFAKAEASARAQGHSLPSSVLAAYARALAPTRPAEALAKMAAAVALDPQNAALTDEYGSLYAQQERWSEAEQQFRKALLLDPKLGAAHLHLGATLESEHEPGSLQEFERAAQLEPDNPTVLFTLAKAYVAADRDQQAISLFEQLMRGGSRLPEVGYELALALQRTGKPDEAIPLFEKTLAADPANARAETNLGMALTQIQHAQEAVPHLQRAVSLDPKMVTAHENLAAAYIQLNQIDDAVAQLKLAIALAPEVPELHYNLGLAYKMQDDASAAIPELEMAEKQNPDASEPPLVLGLLYMQSGRYEDAARELDRSLKLHPDNSDGWATLGSVDAKLDRLPEAVAALREAIRQNPHQPDPHLTLAAILIKQGNTAEATAERKQAAELMRANANHQRAEVATNSGNSLFQTGKVQDAMARYKEALAFDPQYAEAHLGLAKVLEREGDMSGAQSERAKAQSAEHAAPPAD